MSSIRQRGGFAVRLLSRNMKHDLAELVREALRADDLAAQLEELQVEHDTLNQDLGALQESFNALVEQYNRLAHTDERRSKGDVNDWRGVRATLPSRFGLEDKG